MRGTEPGQAAADVRGRALAWALIFAGVVLALLWARAPHAYYVGALAVPVLAAAVLLRRPSAARPRDRAGVLLPAALATLLGILAATALTQHRLAQLTRSWDALLAERTADLAARLQDDMSGLSERGRTASNSGARAVAEGRRGLFGRLEAIREQTGVAALAVLDEDDELLAWAGEHRGVLPAAALAPGTAVAYVERPLFSYLYFSTPVDGEPLRALAAVLLERSLSGSGGEAPGLATDFESRTGARPLFIAGAGADAVWSLHAGGRPVVSASFAAITQAEWRARVVSAGRAAVLALCGLALLLLALAWPPVFARRRTLAAPLLAIALVLPVAPLSEVELTGQLFSPALFLLPVPGDLTLGTLLAVAIPLAVLTSVRPWTGVRLAPRWAAVLFAAAVVGLAFPLLLSTLTAAAAPSLFSDDVYLWAAFQGVALLLLTIVAGICLGVVPRGGAADGSELSVIVGRRILLLAAAVLSATLALLVSIAATPLDEASPWWTALWAVPFGLAALGMGALSGGSGRLLRWLLAGWLAATATLPTLWHAQSDARLSLAEREIATLGTRTDPFLDYLLRQFAAEVASRSEEGDQGVDLLYRAWVGSGLAREGYPVHLALWTPDLRPQVELGLAGTPSAGILDPPPPAVRAVLERSRRSGQNLLELPAEAPGVGQVLAVPLGGGELASVIVPPRRTLERTSVLAPFLGAEPRPTPHFTLVPAVGRPTETGTIRWRETPDGWRSEAFVRYPEGEFHAHLLVPEPSFGVRVARAMLLLAVDLAVLALLWLLGRLALGDLPGPRGGWRRWLGSFRARVTLSLFAFFLAPTVLFGTVAYRAAAGEVTRAARILAERAASQAALEFPDSLNDLRALSGRLGEEVLYFHRGELAGSSSPEALELGLYGAWMPPRVFLTLYSGEEISAVDARNLGPFPYVLAYQRLPAAGTVAVPVSLASGEAAIRQRELAHLVLFAVLVGGLLSLALSVLVGRALAGPISLLRRASASVGAGRLRVRLPEERPDEFGVLYTSFNRMVRRLRRARSRELQTARVLAWGEMARQIAHEIKNPLTPIKLSVQHLRRAYADGRPDFGAILEENSQQILQEIDRLTEIARAFSRYGAPAGAAAPLEPVDVKRVVGEALTLYRAGDEGIRYLDAIPADLPAVRARAGELKEVVLNLLENARAALDGSGTIQVRAWPHGESVELVVEDDGQGMSAETLGRIFEPHFSTRSAGTGLGLAIVRRLAESWGGSVTAESEPGVGTAVRLRIPLASGELSAERF